MAVNGIKSVISGTSGADDLRVAPDGDGTTLAAGAGNDILRGGKFNDVLIGGSGDDQMFGGAGADRFVFSGREIEGASDRDRIYDLTFDDGDTIVLGSYARNTFGDAAGLDGYAGGTSAVISSYSGLASAAASSDMVTALRASPHNDNLLLRLTNEAGQVQEILISNAWTDFLQAGGSDGL